jgi:lipopolysaccharide biosynthesis glycosyltransferase
VVLRGATFTLDERFNCITNMRKIWPALRPAAGPTGRLLHFVDYPKPWSLFGEFVHPQARLWRAQLQKTALGRFRSWHATPARRLPANRKAWNGYKKAFKDRLLFAGYSRGWLKRVKGMVP